MKYASMCLKTLDILQKYLNNYCFWDVILKYNVAQTLLLINDCQYTECQFSRDVIHVAETKGTNINIVKYFKHSMRQYFKMLLNQYTYQNRISEFHNKYIKDNFFLDLNNSKLTFKYPLEN